MATITLIVNIIVLILIGTGAILTIQVHLLIKKEYKNIKEYVDNEIQKVREEINYE